MDVSMKMPDLSTITATVTIVRWLVDVGESVRRGDPLMEVETDKSTMLVESPLSGTLSATLVNPGDHVPAGATIALFVSEGPAQAPYEPPRPAEPIVNPTQSATIPAHSVAPTPRSASFFARNRAAGPDSSGDSPR